MIHDARGITVSPEKDQEAQEAREGTGRQGRPRKAQEKREAPGKGQEAFKGFLRPLRAL